MDLGIDGKLALVTGSTAGIGLATARALAEEGARVTVNGRTKARVMQAVDYLKRELPKARVEGIAADLSGAAGCAELVRQLPRVDILVNNMGIFEPKPFPEISDADWLRFFETNVLSGIRLSRHYLPGMRENDWQDRVRLQRIRGSNPGRNDSLWHDEDRADRRGTRTG
jgi:NAD(P)-dependent dehydrogenase (short-subunit alcohol dehydrogenase family)